MECEVWSPDTGVRTRACDPAPLRREGVAVGCPAREHVSTTIGSIEGIDVVVDGARVDAQKSKNKSMGISCSAAVQRWFSSAGRALGWSDHQHHLESKGSTTELHPLPKSYKRRPTDRTLYKISVFFGKGSLLRNEPQYPCLRKGMLHTHTAAEVAFFDISSCEFREAEGRPSREFE